jgi:hypothetical protein
VSRNSLFKAPYMLDDIYVLGFFAK